MYCKKCGKEADENEKFCTSCGTPLLGVAIDSNEAGEAVMSATKPAKKRAPLIVGICVAIVAVIGIAVGFFALTPIGQEVSSDMGIEIFDEPEYKKSKVTTVYNSGLTTVQTLSYDSEGRTTSLYTTEEYEDDDGEVQTAEYKTNITYLSDTDWIYEKSVTNAQDASENEAFQSKTHETLNDKGDPIERTTERDDGSTSTSSMTYEYYPNGQKKSYICDYTYSSDMSDEHAYKYEEYSYDEDGNVLEEHVEQTDGFVTEVSYTYDADGTLVSKVSHITNGSTDNTTTYQCDEFGNVISETYEDGKTYEYELTLDDEGRVLREVRQQVGRVTDADGKYSVADGKDIYEYQYDSNGNMIYTKYESYELDADESGKWNFEVYTEYVTI